jgi:hypothetical protein
MFHFASWERQVKHCRAISYETAVPVIIDQTNINFLRFLSGSYRHISLSINSVNPLQDFWATHVVVSVGLTDDCVMPVAG